MRSINTILRRNLEILTMLLESKEAVNVNGQLFDEKGFNFYYHTHTYQTEKAKVFPLSYDGANLPLQDMQLEGVNCGEGHL